MKRSVLSFVLLFVITASLLTVPTVAREAGPDSTGDTLSAVLPPTPAGRVEAARRPLLPSSAAAAPEQWGWQYGPPSDFQYQRFDGAFVPGPAGEPWANKVYFLGGRIAAPSELPNIWMFDPITELYSDTGADMIEDVSNYNCDLILDDGTGRGPAVYVIGGYDKDGGSGGGGLGMVQRYYPQFNLVESLPPADDWPGQVGGYTVAGQGTATVDDVIYVFGGWQSDTPPYFYDGTWAFDPRQPSGSRWTNLGVTMNVGRTYIQTAAQDGRIYAMGGISAYVGGDLVPTDVVEVLDTANPGAGWQPLSPMPIAVAEGRGFGFDSDTLGTNYLAGRLYVVGGGDWPDTGLEVMEYIIATDTWNQDFPDLNEDRVNLAGAYIPLYTADPTDGLPGMWVFGGRWDNGCDPPYGPTEFYPLPLAEQCSILLVDDDWDQYSGEPFNGGGAAYYTSTLEALGFAYDRWDVWTQGDPALADLQGYDAVIWFTGYAWEGTVTGTNEADLAAYLDGGGNLFLSGYDYLYDQGLTAFGTDYLRIEDYLEDTGEVDPVGTPGDVIGDGLGPYTLIVPTSWPSGTAVLSYTDEILPAAGSSAPFRYFTTNYENSTDTDSGIWRTVFLGWPFEGLADLGDRVEVMSRVLNWFCYTGRPAEVLLTPPEQSASAVPGTEVPYALSLINNTGATDTFNLDYASAWPIAGPASIGPLDHGTAHDFVVTVTVPAEANCGDLDSAVITASSTLAPSVYSDTALLHSTAAAPGLGALSGTVYDANTGLGIPDARLYLALGDFYTETWTDAAGAYQVDNLDACCYTGGAEAVRYESAAFTVSLEVDLTTTLDLTLNAPLPALFPTAVSVTLPVDLVAVRPVTLTNLGTSALTFTIFVVPSDTYWLGVTPLQGLVDPPGSAAISLTLDASGLNPGECYFSSLLFAFNDPYGGQTSLPVELCVTESGWTVYLPVVFKQN